MDIKECDLVIKKKFDDFKSEFFAYDNITNDEYDKIMQKALEKKKTQKVRRIKAKDGSYGIAEYATMDVHHLMAIILYCDYDDHCSRFSESFRSLTATETLDETKKRNSNYYWMARRLAEAVQVFGQNRAEHNVIGPFFCGMNKIMIIPQFHLTLNSPTSTTLQMCVAEGFAGDNGMILQLNNNSRSNMDHLKSFDASFISHYAEEQERYDNGFLCYSIISSVFCSI